jgi:hypothetical protein
MAMKRMAVCPLALMASVVLAALPGQWFSRHKSKAEVERMTPEQRVQEYCREYVRRDWAWFDYGELVESYIFRDGIKRGA